ncbi:MAG: hypothetical protein NZ516_02520 [Raineya sp.]|nr:hypothetical protein [Raineya sp.]
MKKLVFSCVWVLFSVYLFAQSDKEQQKIWREKLNKMSVEEFKAISEANNFLPARISKIRKEISENQALVNAKDEEIAFLQKRITQLESEITGKTLKNTNSSENSTIVEPTQSLPTVPKDDFNKGVVFRLQIGASDKLDLNVSNEYDLRVEQDGKMKKYTLGNFRSFEKAEAFKNCLPDIGIKGGWVVAYKDGVRVPLKEVK